MRSSRETELPAVYPMADVCQWLGHSPAVAARFDAQSRSEVADKAAKENTVHIEPPASIFPGSKMGPVVFKKGSKMGPVSDLQKSVVSRQESVNTHQNLDDLMDCDGLLMPRKIGEEGLEPPTFTV